MMNPLQQFIALSNYAGQRFDLVQAGGGNTSVKLSDGSMVIKASGCHLSEVSHQYGHTRINNTKLLALFNNPLVTEEAHKKAREEKANRILQDCLIEYRSKPSIEAFMHAFLDEYVLHTHPIAVNVIGCKKNWETIFHGLFADVLCVPYYTPGIDLALAIKKQLADHPTKPSCIFLQNHGLIVHHDNMQTVVEITENIINTCEHYVGIDFSAYKATTAIADLITRCGLNIALAPLLCQDSTIIKFMREKKHLLATPPAWPDVTVYCGYKPVELQNFDDEKPIIDYLNRYQQYPKVIVYQDQVYFIAPTIKKARDVEEVFRSHVITLGLTISLHENNLYHHLSEDECLYLNDWDAEKYRQNL